MTLQEFIDFDQYVRCFTFGKTDIVPVHYDPRERRYIVNHTYLSSDLGERVIKDAQTINQALGYEMNTIEFAVANGVPYAIDFLNPAPDFERDRITQHYFDLVLDKMSRLVIDRALSGAQTNPWPRWEQMVGIGPSTSGVDRPTRPVVRRRPRRSARRPGLARRARASRRCSLSLVTDAIDHWHSLLRPEVELTPAYADAFTAELRARHLHFGDRIHCPFLRPFFLDDEQLALVTRVSETIARMGETLVAASTARPDLFEALALTETERSLVSIDPGYQRASTASRLDSFILPGSLQFAEYNAESPAGLGYTETLVGVFDTLAVTRRFRERYDATRAQADGADARRAPGQLPRVGRHGEPADDRHRGLPRRADVGRVRDAAGALHRAGRADARVRPARPGV